MALQTRKDCCDEFCPLQGMPCGLPEPPDIKKGLESTPQLIWMCHSNPNVACTTTDYIAEQYEISLDEENGLRIEDSEEFLGKLRQEGG